VLGHAVETYRWRCVNSRLSMVGAGDHLGFKFDPLSELLFDFARVTNAQKAGAVEAWSELLCVFAGMRNALQTAVGQPSASRCTFNVFEVTRRSGFEVTTHSALLCDLLDPRGTHGQGGAFLRAFLALVDDHLPRNTSRVPWPPADGWWSVVPEFRCSTRAARHPLNQSRSIWCSDHRHRKQVGS
jgi:PD-(D/E)XK nuclease superfamily